MTETKIGTRRMPKILGFQGFSEEANDVNIKDYRTMHGGTGVFFKDCQCV